jgi:hypothetical protein
MDQTQVLQLRTREVDEVWVIAWDKHNNMSGLNRLMESEPTHLDIYISPQPNNSPPPPQKKKLTKKQTKNKQNATEKIRLNTKDCTMVSTFL